MTICRRVGKGVNSPYLTRLEFFHPPPGYLAAKVVIPQTVLLSHYPHMNSLKLRVHMPIKHCLARQARRLKELCPKSIITKPFVNLEICHQGNNGTKSLLIRIITWICVNLSKQSLKRVKAQRCIKLMHAYHYQPEDIWGRWMVEQLTILGQPFTIPQFNIWVESTCKLDTQWFIFDWCEAALTI